ncbi:hypothetical protein [Streptomyces sp. WMMB 322]|uniref:hypothetical protein n=1 Tax=Streptomyces sp. WMMB 322 TaxID=1286821 RepID=UPI0008239F4D|nr:hypothetical protein [Streptomyces sp. WMMB 322]SCK05311.1 hypothetical protein H180DRAFT_00059 [Streptomyces sp. WMMB 322]
MPVFALALAAAVIGFEQLVEWQFGPVGVIGFVLLSVGVKAKNVTCSCIGAVVLTMLIV